MRWLPADPLPAVFWSLVTIGLYFLAKRVHGRLPRWWLMPLAVAPLLVGIAVVALHVSYTEYIRGTGWLVLALGPTTVAFAIPIYEQRALLARYWRVLLTGMIAGSATAMVSSWLLATLVGLEGSIRLSLLPRSVSTPFAMAVSAGIGGSPDLTAVFAVLTGISGAIIGDMMVRRVPAASALARGALLGVGAHGAGTARAHQLGQTEGAVAGLTMVLAGLLNVLAAPLLAVILR